jgi:hypothetical protein
MKNPGATHPPRAGSRLSSAWLAGFQIKQQKDRACHYSILEYLFVSHVAH